jgi:hypothetical protein
LREKIKEAQAKLEEPLLSEPVPFETPQLASAPAATMPLGELIQTAGETAAFEIIFEGKIKINKITLKR